jgi:hypothetical protein
VMAMRSIFVFSIGLADPSLHHQPEGPNCQRFSVEAEDAQRKKPPAVVTAPGQRSSLPRVCPNLRHWGVSPVPTDMLRLVTSAVVPLLNKACGGAPVSASSLAGASSLASCPVTV